MKLWWASAVGTWKVCRGAAEAGPRWRRATGSTAAVVASTEGLAEHLREIGEGRVGLWFRVVLFFGGGDVALLVYNQGELDCRCCGAEIELGGLDGVDHVSVARKTFDAMPRATRGEACWADDRRFDAELADELAGWKTHDLMAL